MSAIISSLAAMAATIVPVPLSTLEQSISHALICIVTVMLCRKLFNKGVAPPTNKAPPGTEWIATIQQTKFSAIEKSSSGSSADREKFLALFPHLVETIEAKCRENELPPGSMQWIGNMVRYNVIGGKLNRGLQVIIVERTLKPGGKLTGAEFARASILGWSIEFLQAFFLVADDVMDDSVTRRGQPCWYKNPHVNMIAINDSFLLESFVFTLIKTYFGHEAYYGDLVDLFLSVIQKTEFGQLLDLTSQDMVNGEVVVDLDRFTIERYKLIVKYKTAYYTFYLPIAIGMITSGVKDKAAFAVVEEICCAMGEYFQVQDDFLDCYGDPAVIGKVGTDIQDNKCSWLVVQALNRSSPAQKKVLSENYGRDKEAKIKKVKGVYEELDLKGVFEKYEKESYDRIRGEMNKVEKYMPRDIFELLLKKIYKRSK